MGQYYTDLTDTGPNYTTLPPPIEPQEDHIKFYGLNTPPSSISFISGSLGDVGQQRQWAGSDIATQAMIADWVKQVVQSDMGGFRERIYPGLSGEEKECIENLIKS